MRQEDAAATEQVAEESNEVVTGAMDAITRVAGGDTSGEAMMGLWTYIGWPITQAVLLIIAVIFVAGWMRGLASKAMGKAGVEETLSRFIANLIRWAVLLLGALAILSTFGVDTTSFAAVLAALGFAVGMALSGTLGNFAAGVMLLVFRPFKVGDVITTGGTTGKVDAIELFSTTLDTPDNRRIIVPNGSVFGGEIENITFHDTRRVDVAVGTDYSADLDETRKVLEKSVEGIEGILPDPASQIYLVELGDSSIAWAVRVWSTTADYWGVRERVTRSVKVHLDQAGIGIPFPQMDVHLDGKVER